MGGVIVCDSSSVYDADEILLSGEKSEPSLVEETAGEEIYPLLGGSAFRQIRRVQRKSAFPVFCFVFFKCLLLKIIHIPQQHILGWHFLPFNP